jgi:hypothetical protein
VSCRHLCAVYQGLHCRLMGGQNRLVLQGKA